MIYYAKTLCVVKGAGLEALTFHPGAEVDSSQYPGHAEKMRALHEVGALTTERPTAAAPVSNMGTSHEARSSEGSRPKKAKSKKHDDEAHESEPEA